MELMWHSIPSAFELANFGVTRIPELLNVWAFVQTRKRAGKSRRILSKLSCLRFSIILFWIPQNQHRYRIQSNCHRLNASFSLSSGKYNRKHHIPTLLSREYYLPYPFGFCAMVWGPNSTEYCNFVVASLVFWNLSAKAICLSFLEPVHGFVYIE